LNYHWPPGSWRELTIPQLIRIYEVEARMAEKQTPEAPFGSVQTGSDTADD